MIVPPPPGRSVPRRNSNTGEGGGCAPWRLEIGRDTGEASRAGLGTPAAMADQGAPEAMVELEIQEAMADQGALEAMVKLETQEAMANQGVLEAMAELETREAMAEVLEAMAVEP